MKRKLETVDHNAFRFLRKASGVKAEWNVCAGFWFPRGKCLSSHIVNILWNIGYVVSCGTVKSFCVPNQWNVTVVAENRPHSTHYPDGLLNEPANSTNHSYRNRCHCSRMFQTIEPWQIDSSCQSRCCQSVIRANSAVAVYISSPSARFELTKQLINAFIAGKGAF